MTKIQYRLKVSDLKIKLVDQKYRRRLAEGRVFSLREELYILQSKYNETTRALANLKENSLQIMESSGIPTDGNTLDFSRSNSSSPN